MRQHVCPWWGGYFLDNPLRRLLHSPTRILCPFIQPGMTVADFGCGMGVFSIPMARMVGPDGTVIAIDLQPRMLETLRKRAKKAGVASRIRTHACKADSIDLQERIDFALLFWSAHEAPDTGALFRQLHGCLDPTGKILLVEPRGHVTQSHFQEMVDMARKVGFALEVPPKVRLSHTAVFVKTD